MPGPAQTGVAPGVVDEPARLTDVTAQVKFCGGPALALGGVLLRATVVVAVNVHPLDGFVTVIV